MDITVRDYYLIRKTVIDMLYDRSDQALQRFFFERGSLDLYNMLPYETVEEIYNTAVNEDISYLNFEYKSEGQRVMVCFLNDATKLEQNINKFKRLYKLTGNTALENIYNKPITDTNYLIVVLCNAKKPNAGYFQTDQKNVEIFWHKQLTFNVSKHSMVPKHELIHPAKKEELKKIYFLERLNQLPTLLKEDPVAKYYGMLPGDICRITRENPNIGTSIMYRYVSDI